MWRGSGRGRGRGRGGQNHSNMIRINPHHPLPHAARYGKEYGPVRVTNIAVLGHSFVSGLNDSLTAKRTRDPDMPSLQDQLDLKRCLIMPHLWGIKGGHIENLRDKESEIRECSIDAIVFDIGSNDLCKNTNVQQIVNTLRGLTEHWIDSIESIKAIVACQQLHRNYLDPQYSTKSLWKYNKDVDTFNERLEEWINNSPRRLEVWKHKNFTHPTTPCIGPDGVHPNTPEGAWRYQKSVRGAIVFADRFTQI